MSRLRRFLRLPPAERSLLLKAALLLAGTRLALAVIPLRLVRRRLHTVTPRAAASARTAVSQRRVGWAVSVVSRFVPRVSCLAQAVVTEALLRTQGHSADLCIGVARGSAGALDAHAWVESDGQVVIGGLADLSRYSRLPRLPGEER